MAKEWVRLISVGNATTRIVELNAELVRTLVPEATKDTKLQGKWTQDKEGKRLILEVREG